MTKHSLIGIDLAKNVFQICAMTPHGKISFNRALKRADLKAFMVKQEATIVAMEACYSSHYWAREFVAMGHTVQLIPAQHVKPFVRGNKSDRNDAVAICEASKRPEINTVPIKTLEQSDIQCLHRIRERHIKQRTSLINQARGLLAEYGIIAPLGLKAFKLLLHEVCSSEYSVISPSLKTQFMFVTDEYCFHTDRIDDITVELNVIAKANPLCHYLLSIPGIGPINATAIISAIGNGQQFKNGREFAVWLGLTPKQSSSGERGFSGGITKRGNRYLRKQLVHGARAMTIRCRNKKDNLSQWVNQLLARRGVHKTYVAVAARLARTAWVLLNKQETYREMSSN